MTIKESDMFCVFDQKVKVRHGTAFTIVQDVLLSCGTYAFVVEDDIRRVQLLKSHNFALGDILITSNDGDEIMKEVVDFRKEYPFKRDIHVHPAVKKDGASDEKDECNTINIHLTISSTAHIKSVRLRAKLLCSNENYKAQILTSQTSEKKRNKKHSGSTESLPTHKSDNSTNNSTRSSSSLGTSRYDDTSTWSSISAREEIDDEDDESVIIDDTVADKHVDVVEKDVLYIEKSSHYTSEGVEHNNNVQITLEHTKTISDDQHISLATSSSSSSISGSFTATSTTTPVNSGVSTGASSTALSRPLPGNGLNGEFDSLSSNNSQSAFDPTEENLVYYKEAKLKKKQTHIEIVPIQQRGRYYLVIENIDKGPINRRFSCHLTLSDNSLVLKESYTNDAKKKICDDFTVEMESAKLKLELVNTNTSFGSTEIQISLYMRNTTPQEQPSNIHPYLQTGEIVWSASACEVEKKHPQKLTANIPTSGRYYIVVEKVDKIYGGLREVFVTAHLTEPVKDVCGNDEKEKEKEITTIHTTRTRTSMVANVVVGGIKERPMKWKSNVFVAPAGSTVEFNVESFAIVGSITYSLRIRKVPGLTAEEERTRRNVVLFFTAFGIYYFFYIALSIIHFIQNIGFTFHFLFISVDITLGRICFLLFIAWCKTNKDVLVIFLKDIRETIRKIIRKINYIRDMSDGGKFDILRIFKQMSKEGKANDLRKWEMQKIQTAHE